MAHHRAPRGITRLRRGPGGCSGSAAARLTFFVGQVDQAADVHRRQHANLGGTQRGETGVRIGRREDDAVQTFATLQEPVQIVGELTCIDDSTQLEIVGVEHHAVVRRATAQVAAPRRHGEAEPRVDTPRRLQIVHADDDMVDAIDPCRICGRLRHLRSFPPPSVECPRGWAPASRHVISTLVPPAQRRMPSGLGPGEPACHLEKAVSPAAALAYSTTPEIQPANGTHVHCPSRGVGQ